MNKFKMSKFVDVELVNGKCMAININHIVHLEHGYITMSTGETYSLQTRSWYSLLHNLDFCHREYGDE